MPASPSNPPQQALVAIDLGAESCRVSLLRWPRGSPEITLVHRFPNAPVERPDGLHWDLAAIEAGVLTGLRRAAGLAPEGIRSIAADGWAVDYVRLDTAGNPLADPFCYRDPRTLAAESWLHQRISPQRMVQITATFPQRINTLYQLVADRQAALPPGAGWIQLPEYILYRLGGRPAAEATNAAHGQLVDIDQRAWSKEIFAAAGLDPASAPLLTPPGTDLGQLTGPLSALPAYRHTRLIAPACHDTAAAIAGIPALGPKGSSSESDWAYISSGTWSLVGTLVTTPIRTPAAAAYTNLAGAGGLTLFHANLNGMWPLRQCMNQWDALAEDQVDPIQPWLIDDLIAAAERLPAPATLIDSDHPELLLPGGMMQRINAQLISRGHAPHPERSTHAPVFANLIFHSLAARYRAVLAQIAELTGKEFRRVFIVGGGSRNVYLNRLIAEATGLEVFRGSPESSTLGNFAIQLAVLEGHEAPSASVIYRFAAALASAPILS